MSEKSCRREKCQFAMEVFGESEPSESKCLYPDVEWEKVEVDQALECEACPALSIHGGSLLNVKINRSKTPKITFRLRGNYHRPTSSEDLYIALQVAKDPQWPCSLILRCPAYICEAYQADGLTLEVCIPQNYRFNSLAINARSIHTSIPLCASNRVRLNAAQDIVAKLSAPWIYANAETGICITCEANKKKTTAEILCRDYIELTLDGYDRYVVTSPVPQQYVQHNYRLALNPTEFKGKVLSSTCDAVII